MKKWLNLLGTAALALAASTASAQNYPDRPVHLIVPFAAGGPADIQARWIATKLSDQLKQQVVVENKGGAGGIIGAQHVAGAAPDGYTLLFSSVGAIAISPYLRDNLAYDPRTDLTPVIKVSTASTVLVTSAKSRFSTLSGLIDYARSNPGKVTFASPGAGTSIHLGSELLKQKAGIDMVHVPYRGAGPAITDVIAGTVDVMFADAPVVLPHIKAGTLRALGVGSLARAPVLPDTPTMEEGGAKDVLVATWYGIMAPGKTPPAIVQTLNKAMNAVLSSEDAKTYFAQQGMQINGGTPEDFGKFINTEVERWVALAKGAGVKLN